ncbi:MAG: putative capsid protein [Hanko totivirus 8]|nr:MAG: putative capsid protein [Hanko totivirus 8]UUV42235.1 MAG: putative capsid protein [Hanko totivirus 8]
MSGRKLYEKFLKSDGRVLRSGHTIPRGSRGRGYGPIGDTARALDYGDGDKTREETAAVSETPEVLIPSTSTSVVDGANKVPGEVPGTLTSQSAPELTVQEFIQDGLEVEGRGIMKEGDVLIPLDSAQKNVILIPETSATEPTPEEVGGGDGRGMVDIPEVVEPQVTPTLPGVSSAAELSPNTRKRTADILDSMSIEDMMAIQKMVLEAQARYAAGRCRQEDTIETAMETVEIDDQQPSTSRASGAAATATVPAQSMRRLRQGPRTNSDADSVHSGASWSGSTPSIASEPEFYVPHRTEVVSKSQVIRPTISAKRPKPPAPVRAPHPTSDTIDFWRPGGKLGNASVHPVNVEPTRAQGVEDYSMDLIRGLYAIHRGNQDRTNVDDDDLSITLLGVVAIPYQQGDSPLILTPQKFPRTYPEGIAPITTKIIWDNPAVNGKVDQGVASSYQHNGQPDARTAANVIKGKVTMSGGYLAYAAPQLLEGMASYHLVGLFTALYILIDYSTWIDKTGAQRGHGNAVANAVTTVDVNCDANGLGAAVEASNQAILQGRIPLRAVDITTSDISVMNAIAAGPDYIRIPEDGARFIHKTISWKPILWVVWESGAVVLPGAGTVTTSMLITFLYKITELLNAHLDAVTGFVRAHSILNGVVVANQDKTKTWITGTLEVERIYIPKPKGKNFIWNVLTSEYEYTWKVDDFKEEYRCILNFTTDEMIQVGCLVSGTYSLAVSSMLDNFNITGNNINSWANNTNTPVNNFLYKMFRARPDQETIFLFSLACNAVPQFCGMKVAWQCFQTSRWSGGFTHRRNLGANAAWGRNWGNWSPFLMRPETMEFVIEKWLSTWGITAAGASYNISHEMYSSGNADAQGLMLWMGDDKYTEMMLTSTPFMKNPYGQMLTNLIKQEWRVADPWIVSYRYLKMGARDTVLVDPEYHVDEAWQPGTDPATFSTITGSWPTFKWDTMEGMAPTIMRNDMGAIWYRLAHHLNVERSIGGYCSRTSTDDSRIAFNGYDFDRLFLKGGSTRPLTIGEPPADTSNMEN